MHQNVHVNKALVNFILTTLLLTVKLNIHAQALNDWENPALVSKNSMPPHAWFIPYPSEKEASEKTSSPFIRSLDGSWKFKLSSNPSERPMDFFKNGYDVSKWNNIKVPADWQTEGFDKFIFTDVEYPIPPNPPFVPSDYNPVGSYKKSFDLPRDWEGKNVFIHLGAVNSFFYIWINGVSIGFSKDSKTPAEFDITRYVNRGKNIVSLQVFRFSDGTYLEGQDMWKLSGIERSVYLIARPTLSVYDFHVKAGLDSSYTDGIFGLNVSLNRLPDIKNTSKAIEIKLVDEFGNIDFIERQNISANSNFRFATRIKNVRQWNAEQPNLYALIINMLDKNDHTIESISTKIGFRTVEISHGLLLVNGVAVKIKGVNRHEHDMMTGKVITTESMKRDIRLFKRYNINAMRCSHYPNGEEWYALCDQYGIYVVDEVNIECDGMSFHPMKTLSDKPDWLPAYLDRTKRMFERDKNFCSIIIWSLGNESQFGNNLEATYRYLKTVDDSRPVQYEAAGAKPFTDIICPMYQPLHVMQEYVRYWKPRPFIQVEYAHMMGNSGGNLEDDWNIIYKYPQLQGGFIWDFSDQAFKKKDTNGRDIWAYGRDMGNVGATSDTSFCADGLFAADRTPHPQAFELKKVYQNIAFSNISFSDRSMNITNRFDFINLKNYEFSWHIKTNGLVIASASLGSLDIAPHQTKEVNLDIPSINPQSGTEYYLFVEAKTKASSELFPYGFVIAEEQFKLPWKKASLHSSTEVFPSLQKLEDGCSVKIFNPSFSITFNQQTGWLEQFSCNNENFIYSPLQPSFWRAATDNDIGNSQQLRCEIWQHATENARLDSFTVINVNEQQIEVRTAHYLPKVDATYFTRYIISANEAVNVKVTMKAGSQNLPEMPRFGMRVLLKKEYDNVTWFGRGPYDNYWDRNYAANVDLYSLKADSMFHPYARAQESGYRTDVRWMCLRNKNGTGLMVQGEPAICTGVLHFDMHKLDFDRDAPENNHGGSITNDDFIWWNIDSKQMGLGGDNSWGAKAHSEYMLPYTSYEYSFVLKPTLPNGMREINK